jgi:hypothetical protein
MRKILAGGRRMRVRTQRRETMEEIVKVDRVIN